jgi:hypothetical protein
MSTSVASVAGPSEYIRISKTLADRNYKLYPRDSFKIEDIITTAQNTDYYQSLYLYNDHHYNKWKETGSVAGIIDVKTNRLIMDFDAKDIEHARRDTKIAVERLKVAGVNESAIQVYFSGNKGFHIQVDLIERLDRKDFEAIVFGMCGDLKTIDRQIKDQQRLIRVPFTKNPNSGLYKIPLTIKDLDTSILMIKDKARSLREEDWDLFSTWQNNHKRHAHKSTHFPWIRWKRGRGRNGTKGLCNARKIIGLKVFGNIHRWSLHKILRDFKIVRAKRRAARKLA